MAELEDDNLRSLNSDVPTYVTFINRTQQDARAWWLDFSGKPVSYGDIQPRQSMDMGTFLTHPWVFRCSRYGAKLLANKQDVYFPEAAEFGEDEQPVSLHVTITSPVYSLKETCSMFIRKFVKCKDFNKLDIPESLKEDLKRSMNIEQDFLQR